MKIIIADDDKLVSLSLKTILESEPDITVALTCENGCEAVKAFEELSPDVLLMDIQMGKMNGLDTARHIISQNPEAKILLLTTFSDDEYIIKAIQYGAKGYILKQNFETIAPAIRAVFNGQTVFGNEIMGKIPSLMSNSCAKSFSEFGLSGREFDIVKHVADGLNNREIAETLCLSEGTVRNYISEILEKLELRDRTQLACFYFRNML